MFQWVFCDNEVKQSISVGHSDIIQTHLSKINRKDTVYNFFFHFNFFFQVAVRNRAFPQIYITKRVLDIIQYKIQLSEECTSLNSRDTLLHFVTTKYSLEHSFHCDNLLAEYLSDASIYPRQGFPVTVDAPLLEVSKESFQWHGLGSQKTLLRRVS